MQINDTLSLSRCHLQSDIVSCYGKLYKQDAREAMRVVFSVLTKCICMHKTKFLMNIIKYCFKDYIKLHEFDKLQLI